MTIDVRWCLIAALAFCLGVAAEPAPSVRAPHLASALEQTALSGSDIVVLQRGSDWNRLGEHLYQHLWMDDGFLAALGDGFVLVAIDRKEAAERGDETDALNKAYGWFMNLCPRIALLDRHGRAVASVDRPRSDLTVTALARMVRDLRRTRERRDALWAKADAAQGAERAELLRQGLDVMGLANWTGNGGCYKAIHAAMQAADPDDASGAIRWLGFGPDPRDGLHWSEPYWGKAIPKDDATDADYREALARIDRELHDPRNRILDHERLQRIMIAKYTVYARWKGHQNERLDVQREIAAIDPDTFWGIGARGEIGINHLSAMPMLTYGWAPRQVAAGANTWTLTDAAGSFDHAGPYRLSLSHGKGKDPLTLRRIAFVDGGRTIAEAKPGLDLGPKNRTVTVQLDLSQWTVSTTASLQIDYVAPDGQPDSAGAFHVEPLLTDPSGPALPPLHADAIARGALSELSEQLARHLPEPSRLSAPDAILAQCTLLRECGTITVKEIAQTEGGARFVQDLCSDTAWLESFLASGPASWPTALQNLATLHRQGFEMGETVPGRLATAFALQWGEGRTYNMVECLRRMVQAWKEGLLHGGFDQLDVREMRLTVPTDASPREYDFLLNDRQVRIGSYRYAWSGVRYLHNNVYGASVFAGDTYCAPWEHVLGRNPLLIHRLVGGVCGPCSNYAVALARAHGVPAVNVRQPNHCALIVREGTSWPIGNNVNWPTMTSPPGWKGAGYATMTTLYEPVLQDRASARMAARLEWLALAQQAANDPAWRKTYEAAIAAQPLNYGTWRNYLTALHACGDTAVSQWLDLAQQARSTFAGYGEAAWALNQHCLAQVLPTLDAEARVNLLLSCHRELREDRWRDPIRFPIDNHFDWQARQIGDPDLTVAFVAQALAIHHDGDDRHHAIFGQLLKWGNEHFTKDPRHASAYAAAITRFFSDQGKGASMARLNQTVLSGMEEACNRSDVAGYALWRDMANRLLPALRPGDVHLTAKQAATMPVPVPCAGELVGAEGMLRLSSAHADTRPLSYPQVLNGAGFGGWLDTDNEQRPWARVQLPGDCALTGVILVGRCDQHGRSDSFRTAPLRVAVSIDGSEWREIATLDHDERVFRIDLQDRDIQARYVRVERICPAGGALERISLRRFLVYGTKLF